MTGDTEEPGAAERRYVVAHCSDRMLPSHRLMTRDEAIRYRSVDVDCVHTAIYRLVECDDDGNPDPAALADLMGGALRRRPLLGRAPVASTTLGYASMKPSYQQPHPADVPLYRFVPSVPQEGENRG